MTNGLFKNLAGYDNPDDLILDMMVYNIHYNHPLSFLTDVANEEQAISVVRSQPPFAGEDSEGNTTRVWYGRTIVEAVALAQKDLERYAEKYKRK